MNPTCSFIYASARTDVAQLAGCLVSCSVIKLGYIGWDTRLFIG